MARVRLIEQLGRRDLLAVCWHHIPALIGLLEPKAHWELHRFFRPSENLDDAEFAIHFRRVRLDEPTLSRRVGRHYNSVFKTFQFYADQAGKTNWEEIQRLVIRDHSHAKSDPTMKRSVVILPLVKPQVDVSKVAVALRRAAERRAD